MSTDRELLEWAAKAAGIDAPYEKEWGGMLIPVTIKEPDDGYEFWNPLVDDGDEARLESDLGLLVIWDSEGVTVGGVITSDGDVACGFFEPFHEHGGDKRAARRWAGVRAAAEIGKHSAPSKEES
jgi:hypothetical protein